MKMMILITNNNKNNKNNNMKVTKKLKMQIINNLSHLNIIG